MNSPIKISLTIYLEGSALVRQDKPELIRTDEGKFIKHYPQITKPVTQTINMSEDAYNYFIDDEKPSWAKKHYYWQNMSNRQRVQAHCERICQDLGGTKCDFIILED